MTIIKYSGLVDNKYFMYKCKYCDKEFIKAKSVAAHTKWCTNNPNKKIPFENINIKCDKRTEINNKVNKDKIKIEKTNQKLINLYKTNKLKPPIGKSNNIDVEINRRKKLSESAKKRKLGGYIKGSGRGKKGWYKGFFCDSSWELAFVIYCLEHSIQIERNTKRRTYLHNGIKKNYIPDFIVNNELIEIKGYINEEWLNKHKFNKDVKVLYKNDIIHILDYVKKKYGNNFTNLYEKRKINHSGL